MKGKLNSFLIKMVLVHIFFVAHCNSIAQSKPINLSTVDSLQVDSIIKKDKGLHIQWEALTRTFFMATINQGASNDAYALASGAGIGFVTKPIYGLQLGVRGYFIYKLLSSDLRYADPTGLLPNRYEVGLFDIQNSNNNANTARVEELFIKYTYLKSALSIGKMNLNTPFFNPQDGRMRPTFEEGIWWKVNPSKKLLFNGGWIWGVSPRSTFKWYSLSNSIGIYASGVGVDGNSATYAGNITGCSGMAIANLAYTPINGLKFDFWDGWLENVMNTSLVEIKYSSSKGKNNWYSGTIYLHQNALNNGGNVNPSLTYMEKGAQSNVVSAQVGYEVEKWNTNLNYTHITGDGRYLMPREWGREIFYTFLNRERNEGLGKMNAWVLRTTYTDKVKRMSSTLAYGYFLLPDVLDYRYNKYGLPSYHQVNWQFQYAFDRVLKGLELRVLAACKIKAGPTYNLPKYQFNKVNMLNVNLVVDFKFNQS